MLTHLFILILGLVLLTAGAESLVRSASKLAMRLGISPFVIGLTVVGFGTSTPELATGIAAALRSRVDPSYASVNIGNVVGSNIFNIAFILGLVALIAPIPIPGAGIRREVRLVIAVAIIPFIALATGGIITRPMGAVLVLLLALYIYHSYRTGRVEAGARPAECGSPDSSADSHAPVTADPQASSLISNLAFIAIGLALLIIGSELLVSAAVALAQSIGISELVISLTIVAAGTSAPELFTSFIAALRKQADLSIGNILGSNIFNILGILGASSLVAPQLIPAQIFYLDAPVMLLASIALLPIALSGGRISRGKGAGLFAGYLLYTAVLIILALR